MKNCIMDRKKTGLAVVTTLILSTGFLFMYSSGESSYQNFQDKAASNSYQINYSISFPRNANSSVHNYSSFRLYSSGGTSKQVIEHRRNNTSYRNVSFSSINNTITCSNVEGEIESSDCRLESPVNQFFYTLGKRADVYNISETETSNISDRICQGFKFEAQRDYVPGGSDLSTPAEVDLCIDEEEGYIASMSIEGTLDNASLTDVTLVEIKAEEVNTEFTQNVEPPFDTLIKAKCGASKPVIDLMALEDVGDFTVSLGGDNVTVPTTPYERLEIHIPKPLIEPGTNQFKVYTNNGVRTARCSY